MGGGYDGSTVIRAVTHLDVTREDCARAVEAVRLVCAGAAAVQTPEASRIP
jgi:hypothetical protein